MRLTIPLAAAAFLAAGVFPIAAAAQEAPPVLPQAERTQPPAALPAPDGSQFDPRQQPARGRVQQRYQPDGKGRPEPYTPGQFAVPDRKGETKPQPVETTPATPEALPPAPAPAPPPAAPPAAAPAVVPRPESPIVQVPRRRPMLPQTDGESVSLVAIGAGLAALGIALRRLLARAS